MIYLTHISCFSGIGGLDLASEWAGFQTLAQIENNPYCLKVLQKHWPNVPKFKDIRDVTSNSLGEGGIAKPTVLSGGFPCQPFSVAGKRGGKEDDRYLWPEMFRLVQELRPSWVIGENVPGIINMALDQVLTDLEGEGYTCRAIVVPAAGVNAPHYRDRVFIVAHSPGKRSRRLPIQRGRSQQTGTDSFRSSKDVSYSDGNRYREGGLSERKEEAFTLSRKYSPDVANSDSPRGSPGRNTPGMGGFSQPNKKDDDINSNCEGLEIRNRIKTQTWTLASIYGSDWWNVEPGMGRVANGIPSRVDRLRALGNAVVPQQVYPFFAAIAAIERGVA